MANAFKSIISNAVGVSKVTVYTAPGSTTATAIGLSLANILTTTEIITVDVKIGKAVGGTETYIVRGVPIAPNGSLVAIGGDQKVVLETGDTLKVQSSTAASLDVILSILETT